MRYVFLTVLALSLAPLGNAAAYKKVDSPFLGSVQNFKSDKEHANLFVFRNANKKTVDYKKVIFDPILIYQSPNSRMKQLTADEIVQLGAQFKQMVEAKFKDAVQISTEPGAGVLRARFAIRGLRRGNYYMDGSGDHLIKPDSTLAGATFEMEGIDSLTGERVVGLVQNIGNEEMEKSEREEALQTVQTIFMNWVEMLKGVYLEKQFTATVPK